jgi:adenylate cyclase
MPKVYIMNGPEKGRVFETKKGTILVGRSPENDVQIKDKSVSRVHARILKQGNKYFIKDIKSRNGTFIGGLRIESEKEYEIKEGMPVAIGKTFFSLGKAYPDDVLAFLDSVDLFKELETGKGGEVQDRPLTAKRNMELIYRVSNVLMQCLNTKEILEKILGHILELLKRIDRGVIVLLNGKTGRVGEVVSVMKGGEKDRPVAYSRTIVERVVREGKAISMLDTLNEQATNLSESIRVNNIRSIMCVPLVSRARVIGVIYVDSVSRPQGFRKEDLELLIALSTPAAVAIENSMLCAQQELPVPNAKVLPGP